MPRIFADIKIRGIVQGVGFRPFVHKLCEELELSGSVRNTQDGAALSVEGEENSIDAFVHTLSTNPPSLAYIESVSVEKSEELRGFSCFEIAESEDDGRRDTLVSPDVAVCEECLSELFDEHDRRYGYPFINCTCCGPRFSIIRDVPYDREKTTMAEFSMCSDCRSEYTDITDRRYHAEPDCCPVCGPEVFFCDENGERVCGDAISLAAEALKRGKIVAVKGIGGIHLACSCDEAAVLLLRERKKREEKPLAIMCRDIETAREFAEISDEEEALLSSRARPIVLLKKREGKDLFHISDNESVGIMLPYAPVHHLIFAKGISSLVMTSANLSDLPIIYKNEEAINKLSGIADGFLLNNREIYMRCDDSLVRAKGKEQYFIRRSRGYVPFPIGAGHELLPILACGAEQKASFAMSRGSNIFRSQHIGDLKNTETLSFYSQSIEHFEKLFGIKPKALVCDMHPDFMSTEYAEKRGKKEKLPVIRVQHHHAHLASCMADNGISDKCIGIVWDGTGYGTDGKIWGAEFLVGDFSSFERRGTISPITLPGGDAATHEIIRTGVSLLCDAEKDPEKLFGEKGKLFERILRSRINCPEVTSMGRLFDGVASMLGIKKTVSYEGQAAVLLEAVADKEGDKVYSYSIDDKDGMYVFNYRKMVSEMYEEILRGESSAVLATAFMNTLVSFATELTARISKDTGIKNVALSGGTFQNMYILKRLENELFRRGFAVYTHKRAATNDEGISLGQMMIADAIMKKESLQKEL